MGGHGLERAGLDGARVDASSRACGSAVRLGDPSQLEGSCPAVAMVCCMTVRIDPALRRAAHDHRLRWLAQLGLAGYGVLHLVFAYLVLLLAWLPLDSGDHPADPSGALTLLVATPGGAVMVWLLVAGLAGLAVWQAVEVLRHHRVVPRSDQGRRAALLQLAKTGSTAVLYGYLAVTAATASLGDHRDVGRERHQLQGILGSGLGVAAVVAVSVGTAATGVYLVVKGVRAAFVPEIDLDCLPAALQTAALRTSQLGFVLKGAALVLSGGVGVWAALVVNPVHATGIDGALRILAGSLAGSLVLTAIAAGMVAFALFCGIRAVRPQG